MSFGSNITSNLLEGKNQTQTSCTIIHFGTITEKIQTLIVIRIILNPLVPNKQIKVIALLNNKKSIHNLEICNKHLLEEENYNLEFCNYHQNTTNT